MAAKEGRLGKVTRVGRQKEVGNVGGREGVWF